MKSDVLKNPLLFVDRLTFLSNSMHSLSRIWQYIRNAANRFLSVSLISSAGIHPGNTCPDSLFLLSFVQPVEISNKRFTTPLAGGRTFGSTERVNVW